MAARAFPIITVDDLPGARRFYERLGFTLTYQFPPDGEPGYITLQRGEAHLGIAASERDSREDRFAYWIYVEDVDATMAEIAGVAEVVEPPVDQAWGERVARVRDPAGNLVHLGSPIE